MKISNQNPTGLLIPPPVYYIVSLLMGIGLNYFFPTKMLPTGLGLTIAILLIAISIILVIPVIIKFKTSNTPFDVRKSATVLITDGPYKYSRNPSYLSLTLLYLGFGFLLNNLWILLLVVVILPIINYLVIQREETNLEKIFGEEYRLYKASVRRWL